MGQAFQMMNGPVLNEMLGAKENVFATRLLASEAAPEKMVTKLDWSVLTRAPRAEELERFSNTFWKRPTAARVWKMYKRGGYSKLERVSFP